MSEQGVNSETPTIKEWIVVRNQTPKRLTLMFEKDQGDHHIVSFAPLESRWLIKPDEKRLNHYQSG